MRTTAARCTLHGARCMLHAADAEVLRARASGTQGVLRVIKGYSRVLTLQMRKYYELELRRRKDVCTEAIEAYELMYKDLVFWHGQRYLWVSSLPPAHRQHTHRSMQRATCDTRETTCNTACSCGPSLLASPYRSVSSAARARDVRLRVLFCSCRCVVFRAGAVAAEVERRAEGEKAVGRRAAGAGEYSTPESAHILPRIGPHWRRDTTGPHRRRDTTGPHRRLQEFPMFFANAPSPKNGKASGT